MALKLGPTGSASGSTRTDLTIQSTGAAGTRAIYQTRGGPDNLRWFSSMTVNSPMTRSAFQKNWKPGRLGKLKVP
jgi:hypothetical protein